MSGELTFQERLRRARGEDNDIPQVIRDQEIEERKARILSGIKNAPQQTESPTADDVPEEEKAFRDVQRQTSATSEFAKTLNNYIMPAAGPGFVESFLDTRDEALRMTLGLVGAAHGTVEGVASVVKNAFENAPSQEERMDRIRGDVANTLKNVPTNIQLSEQDIKIAERYARDHKQMEELASGEIFMQDFRDTLNNPVYNYTPLIRPEEHISPYIQFEPGSDVSQAVDTFFGWFEKGGDYVGDKVFEATGDPMKAALAETGINAIPYISPFLGARLTRSAVERKIRRDRAKRINEVQAETPQPEVSQATTPGRMSPEQIRQRVDNFPTDEMILNMGYKDSADVVARFKGTSQQRKVVIEKTQDGRLRIRDGADEVFARQKVKNSKKKPMDVEVIEDNGPKGFNSANAAKAEQTLENMKAAQNPPRGVVTRLKDSIERQGFDASAEVKHRLLEDAGAAGKHAQRRLELTAGASLRGRMKWQGFEDRIYAGLSKSERQNLDSLLYHERIRQIDQIHGIGNVKHPGGITAVEATDALNALRDRVGAGEYARLQERGKIYFDAGLQQLKESYIEGIIDKATFDKLKGDIYQPRRLIERLDRAETQRVRGEAPITVTDSGLNPLGKGTLEALETDSAALMSEYVIRTQNRIMRNKANRALAEAADQMPQQSEWLRRPEVVEWTKDGKAKKVKIRDSKGREKVKEIQTPEGFVKLDYWEGGKQQPVFMEYDMANMWTSSNHGVSPQVANVLRKGSGSFILRPLATGYNPGFALLNFPRDISHVWMASNQYSILPSKYAFQITRDLAVTAKDAWKKDGQFLQFVEEGGGMDFLTHQGRASPSRGSPGQAATRQSRKLRKLKDAGAKVNEFSEIWVRLALRRRALRNGESPIDATWEARSYLDFAQGGHSAKAVDHAVPYLNAAMQAFRTGILRNLKKGERGKFAAKLLAMQEPVLYATMNNWLINPEGYKQIPDKTRNENLIFMLPESFNYKDTRTGEEKSRYLALRYDNNMIPFLAPSRMLMEKYMFDMTPEKDTLGTMLELAESSLPVTPQGLQIPTLTALRTYHSNYNQFWDDNIWHGLNVTPTEEFKTLPQKPTSPFIKEMAQAAGMSPERTEAMIRRIAPSNTWMDMAWFGVDKAMEGLRPDEARRTTGEWIQRAPMLRKVISETHPMARRQMDIERAVQESNARQVRISREVDRLFYLWKQGELERNEFRDWVQGLDNPQDKRSAQKRWETNRVLERVFTRPGNEPGVGGIPGRSWWLALSNVDDVARAQTFYEEWRSQDQENRDRMERIARHLSGTSQPFWSQEAMMEFRRMKEQRGTDID